MKNFLNTPVGSWAKVFLATVLVLVLNHGNIYDLNWKELANTAVMSFIPVLINYLNPNDPRYGKQ